MIIDLHSHLLPGVDDGAQTIEQSLELAKIVVSEGVKHMVLIPLIIVMGNILIASKM